MGRPRTLRPWLRRGAKLALSLVLALVLAELGLRAVLFTDHPGLRRTAARLRTADNFAHRFSPEYWKLMRLFATGERKPTNHEPVVGWLPRVIERGTYDHVEHDPGNGKRPVLLYGDSYAQCVTGAEDCFQGILARSELGSTHQLLNYGVGGQGFDQAFLLLRESIGNYLDEDPVVILSVLVDDDLDRSILPFRGWPKPRLEIGPENELVHPGPVVEDPLEYLERHPPRIASYLWRYVLHATRLVPAGPRARWIGRADTFREIRRLNRRILEEVRAVLEEAGVEYFVLLFHGKGFFRDPPADTWREAFLIQELERLGMPWVSSRRVLEEHQRQSGRAPLDYFILKGNGKGHYNPFGNEVVFEAIRHGLARDYASARAPDRIDAPSASSLPGDASFARFGRRPLPPFEAPDETPRWVLGADPAGPTELRFRLFGAPGSFTATVKLVAPGAHANPGAIELAIELDGREAFARTLAPDADPIPVRVDFDGVHELRLRVSVPPGGGPGVLVLASPEITLRP